MRPAPLAFVLITSAFTFLLASKAAAQTLPSYVPSDGLIAWWPFNGSANDESGNGHHLSVQGAVISVDRSGQNNAAYYFDGVGSHLLGNKLDFSQLTVTLWFKVEEGGAELFLAYDSHPPTGANLIGQGSKNAPCFYCDFALGLSRWPSGSSVFAWEKSAPEYCQVEHDVTPWAEQWGEWQFASVVSDGTTVSQFINGVFQASHPFSSSFQSGGNILSVGSRVVENCGGSGVPCVMGAFQGFIDDIGVWDRALTAEEVMGLYLAGAPPTLGCMDASACNFNPEANLDDGSCGGPCCSGAGCCGVGTVWDAEQGVCVPWALCPDLAYNPDYDGDGAITVTDLLALLAIFEDVDSDGDGIFDSADDCVGVYDAVGECGGACSADTDGDGVCDSSDTCVGVVDACGVCNGQGEAYACGCAEVPPGDCDCFGHQTDALGVCGGSCTADLDADGLCDSVDSCIGDADSCGICNGPGPLTVIDSIVFVTDSIFIPPLSLWYVFSYAVDTLYTTVCPVLGCTDSSATNFDPAADSDDGSCLFGPAACAGQTSVTFDGHTYALVGIGNQCWFKENLRSTHYLNGDPIPGNLSNGEWTSTASGAQAVYNENPANLAAYGRLYNWYAVNDARGLCPAGFHVPSDVEWMELEMALGMSSEQANFTGYRGTNQGTQLKASALNVPSWNGTNSSEFLALPSGYRGYDHGDVFDLGISANWWSTSGFGAHAWYRSLLSMNAFVYRESYDMNYGFSIRCVQDQEESCFDPDNDGICAEDEVVGCTNPEATNYDENATEENGTCIFYDGCAGQTSVTFDGHTYALVGIGDQCWFKENVRYLPQVSPSYLGSEDDGLPHAYVFGYEGGNVSEAEQSEAFAELGVLYNFVAVQQWPLCPNGWHVPSDSDWMLLESALGMPEHELLWFYPEQSARGGMEGVGTKLKSGLWDGTNESGFTAKSSGWRWADSFAFPEVAEFWTSTLVSEGLSWSRGLFTGDAGIGRQPYYPHFGKSVRCVKD